METDLKYQEALITRYLSGEANEAEIAQVADLLKNNAEFSFLFTQLSKSNDILLKRKISQINVDSEFSKFKSAISTKETSEESHYQTNKLDLRVFMRIAAAIVFIFVSGYIIFKLTGKEQTERLIAVNHTLERTLPDGSVVTLNSGSEIEYPEQFKGSERRVKLKGEAYFNIKHNSASPFIVNTNQAAIKVLGTQFNVNSNKKFVEVILTYGKVELYSNTNSSLKETLLPGEKATFDCSTEKMVKTENTDNNYMSWKTGILLFEGASLKSIAEKLSTHYKKEIKISDKELENLILTTKFENQELESVVKVICATLNIKATFNNDLVEFSAK